MISISIESDSPSNGVWGRRPQRVQGVTRKRASHDALVFLIDIIKEDQGSALDPLGAARPDPLSLEGQSQRRLV